MSGTILRDSYPITGPGTALGLDVAEIYPYAEPGDPPPGETLSYWSNLEWQCTDAARDYWGSFRDMPFHCQQQAFENPNSTVSTFTRVVTPPKKDDKEKPQSPSLHIYYSSADDLLSHGLSSTHKKTSQDGSQGTNPGDSCTTPDGEEGTIAPDGNTCMKPPQFTVNVPEPVIDMSEIPGTDVSVSIQPQSEELSPKFDRKKFDDCVMILFGVEVKGIDDSKDKTVFTGYSKELDEKYSKISLIRLFSYLFDVPVGTIPVETTKVSNNELLGPLGATMGSSVVFGVTDPDNPYENKIGNTLGSPDFQKAVWVYELGNALSAITEKTPAITDPSRYGNASLIFKGDVGGALSDCVFGGRVNLNDTVSPPRK